MAVTEENTTRFKGSINLLTTESGETPEYLINGAPASVTEGLAATLIEGNTTDGTDLVVSSGDKILVEDILGNGSAGLLDLHAGVNNPTGGTAHVEGGGGSVTGGTVQLIGGTGGTNGGDIQFIAGEGPKNLGGSIFSIAGNGGVDDGTGAGGDIFQQAGGGGFDGGKGGDIVLLSGEAEGPGEDSGEVIIETGSSQQGNVADVLFQRTTGSVGIGVNSVVASAQLEVSSASRGFLKPRMTTAERDNISSPATGLEIFNITTNQPEFFNGTVWGIPPSPAENFATTLAVDNKTDGNNIVITNNDLIVGEAGTTGATIFILGGFGDNVAGGVVIACGTTDNGPGADTTRTAGPGGTEGGSAPGGDIIDKSGSGNSNNQKSGDLHYFAGNPDGSGAFGNMFLQEDGGNVVVGTDKDYADQLTVRKDSSNSATNIINAIINESQTDNNWAEFDFKSLSSTGSVFTGARTGIQVLDHNNSTKSADYVIKTTHNNILSERFRISDGVVNIPTGKVGIGTNSPTNALEVESGATNQLLRLSALSTNSAAVLNFNSERTNAGNLSIWNFLHSDVAVASVTTVLTDAGSDFAELRFATKGAGGLVDHFIISDEGVVTIGGEVASKVSPTTVEIFTTDDLDALATAGVITVTGKLTLLMKAALTHDVRFVLDGGELLFSSDQFNDYTYSGTGTLFSGAGNIGSFKVGILSSSTGTFSSITSGLINFGNSPISFWDDLGTFSNGLFLIRNGSFNNNVVGITLTNCNINLADTAVINTPVGGGGHAFNIISPAPGTINVITGVVGFIDPSGFILRVDPSFNENSGFSFTAGNIPAGAIFDTTGGATGTFATVADAAVSLEEITSVTDSGGVARFNGLFGAILFVNQEVDIVNFVTQTNYNQTGIITATGAGFFEIASIAFTGNDTTGDFSSNSITCGEVGTALIDGDTLTIKTTLGAQYDGPATVYNQLVNSFQINRTFSITRAGTWNTAGLDQTDPRVLASDNPGFANSEIVAFGSMNANANTTAAVDGTYAALDVTGFIDNAISERFKLIDAVACIYEFTGNEPCSCFVTGFIWATKSGSTGNYRFALSVNGAVPVFASADYSPMEVKTTKVQAAAEDIAQLVKGDTIQWMVAGDGTGDDPTITDFKMRIK